GFAAIFEEANSVRPATFAILTTKPNELMGLVPHPRMPVMLDSEMAKLWLSPGELDDASFASLTEPFPAELMEMRQVSTFVNSPRNEGPECLSPYEGDPQRELF